MVDIIGYLNNHKTRAVTIKELVLHFGVNQPNINRQVRVLAKVGYLRLEIDGKKFKIYWREIENERTEIRPTRIENCREKQDFHTTNNSRRI